MLLSNRVGGQRPASVRVSRAFDIAIHLRPFTSSVAEGQGWCGELEGGRRISRFDKPTTPVNALVFDM